MNIYIVVEGEIGTRYVYEEWIPLINPSLTSVDTIFDIRSNNFAIIAGHGYPFYFDIIENAINDINVVKNIDRLVIIVDSEDMSFDEKIGEVQDFLSDKNCSTDIQIVIQHFCLETWALGNKKVGPRKPKSEKLIEYKKIFNVLEKDPALLPPHNGEDLNRSQFAYKYLRAMLNDKNKHLTYTKNNPKALLHQTYFHEIKKRNVSTGHINSFRTFIQAFS